MKSRNKRSFVIPEKSGIQSSCKIMDSHFRGNDNNSDILKQHFRGNDNTKEYSSDNMDSHFRGNDSRRSSHVFSKIKMIILTAIIVIPFIIGYKVSSGENDKNDYTKTTENSKKILTNIISKSDENNWKKLPMGELMGKIANEFLGTPYVAFTLEGEPEKCTVTLEGLDCVTFFENVLNIARMIKHDEKTMDDLIQNVAFTRYRNGQLTDYTSRLHYTADWMHENGDMDIVADITKELGGVKFPLKVNYMSTHPDKYDALKKHPEYVKIIADIEKKINKRKFYYIPNDKIQKIESKLKTGDIIAFATSIDGLDFTHTGLVFVSADGKARLMHASSTKKKVVLDTTIAEYAKPIKKNIGISVLRVKD